MSASTSQSFLNSGSARNSHSCIFCRPGLMNSGSAWSGSTFTASTDGFNVNSGSPNPKEVEKLGEKAIAYLQKMAVSKESSGFLNLKSTAIENLLWKRRCSWASVLVSSLLKSAKHLDEIHGNIIQMSSGQSTAALHRKSNKPFQMANMLCDTIFVRITKICQTRIVPHDHVVGLYDDLDCLACISSQFDAAVDEMVPLESTRLSANHSQLRDSLLISFQGYDESLEEVEHDLNIFPLLRPDDAEGQQMYELLFSRYHSLRCQVVKNAEDVWTVTRRSEVRNPPGITHNADRWNQPAFRHPDMHLPAKVIPPPAFHLAWNAWPVPGSPPPYAAIAQAAPPPPPTWLQRARLFARGRPPVYPPPPEYHPPR